MRTIKTGLIAALALGGLLALTNVASAQDAKEGKKRGMNPERQLEQMTKELSLTDAQKPKVKAVLEDGAKKGQEIASGPQDERRDKMRALREDQDKKLKEILTPDQYTKWEKMRQEMRKGGKKGKNADTDEKKKE
jgi:Spy/CpxP family protein refolding chaperone